MQEQTLKDIISCIYFLIKLNSDLRSLNDKFNELKPKSKIQNNNKNKIYDE